MKIGFVSKQTGLGIHAIRYYEKQGLINMPPKDSSGHRQYSKQDVDVLNWVSCMKNSGMSLSKIKEYTCAYYSGDKAGCINLLKQHLNRLLTQQNNIAHYIDVTRDKIFRYQ